MYLPICCWYALPHYYDYWVWFYVRLGTLLYFTVYSHPYDDFCVVSITLLLPCLIRRPSPRNLVG
jgi:hypothetical protein